MQNDRVYYLSYELFGMSATFRYPEAWRSCSPCCMPETEEDAAAARENSDNAAQQAEDSNASERTDEDVLGQIAQ